MHERNFARLSGRQGDVVVAHYAGQEFARATVPDTIFRSFMLAHMTGLRKKDGGV